LRRIQNEWPRDVSTNFASCGRSGTRCQLTMLECWSTHLSLLKSTTALQHPISSRRRPPTTTPVCIKRRRKQKYDHITPTLRDDLHWLPVHRRIEYKFILFVFKCRHQMAPSYLSMMCAPLSASDSRRHRNCAPAQGDLDVPFSRISYGERSFPVSESTCWNA